MFNNNQRNRLKPSTLKASLLLEVHQRLQASSLDLCQLAVPAKLSQEEEEGTKRGLSDVTEGDEDDLEEDDVSEKSASAAESLEDLCLPPSRSQTERLKEFLAVATKQYACFYSYLTSLEPFAPDLTLQSIRNIVTQLGIPFHDMARLKDLTLSQFIEMCVQHAKILKENQERFPRGKRNPFLHVFFDMQLMVGNKEALLDLSKLLDEILKVYSLYASHESLVITGYQELDYKLNQFKKVLNFDDVNFGLLASSACLISDMLSRDALFKDDQKSVVDLKIHAMHAAYLKSKHLSSVRIENKPLPRSQRFSSLHILLDLSFELFFQFCSKKDLEQIDFIFSAALDELQKENFLLAKDRNLFSEIPLTLQQKIDYARLLLLLGLAQLELQDMQHQPSENKACGYLNLIKTLSKSFQETNIAHEKPLQILENIASQKMYSLKGETRNTENFSIAALMPMFKQPNKKENVAGSPQGSQSGFVVRQFSL